MSDINKLDIHAMLCDKLKEVYKTKNADYGDSFKKIRDKFGNVAILIRIADKQSRLETLMLSNCTQQVKDESIDDTLTDLANYCLLELTERIADKQEQEVTTHQIKQQINITPGHDNSVDVVSRLIANCFGCVDFNKKECIGCDDNSNYRQE